MIDPTETEIASSALALILAVLDGECDARVHELLCRDDDPHHALRVAHKLAHLYVDEFDVESHPVMREDIAAAALALRGQT